MAQNGTDPITEYQMVARICGAVAYASLIGFEREAKNKPASVRMHMMVAAGSATFVGTALMNTVLWNLGDVNRVAAGVASGVGFLGAATITKKEDRIDGLNTASGIWLVAAIGFTVANGYWMIGLLVTLLAVVTQFGALFFLTPGFYQDIWEKFHGRSYQEEVVEAERATSKGDHVVEETGLVATNAENVEEGTGNPTTGTKKAS